MESKEGDLNVLAEFLFCNPPGKRKSIQLGLDEGSTANDIFEILCILLMKGLGILFPDPTKVKINYMHDYIKTLNRYFFMLGVNLQLQDITQPMGDHYASNVLPFDPDQEETIFPVHVQMKGQNYQQVDDIQFLFLWILIEKRFVIVRFKLF